MTLPDPLRFKKRAPGPGAWLVGLALAAMVLLWLGGAGVQAALRYERDAVLDGEYFRLITGHLVHFDLRHLSLNVAGAALIALLFARTYALWQWIAVLAVSVLSIDLGFLIFKPQLDWYVGASGVLHGALAAGAIAWWRTESRLFAFILSAIVVGKLAHEQLQGALPLAGELPVIVDAHLYGALGGGATAAIVELWLWRGRKSGRTPADSGKESAPL